MDQGGTMATGVMPREKPHVSVIVPVRNEGGTISKCLVSLLAQSAGNIWVELIVVDGNSTDGTLGEIQQTYNRLTSERQQFSSDTEPAQTRFTLKVLNNDRKTVPTSLNIGLEYARGEIIFRLDGHSAMAPNYIDVCLRKLSQSKVAAAGGVSIAVGSGLLSRVYAQILRSPFGVGGNTFRTISREALVDTLAFAGYRRDVFDHCGNFNERLSRNQDIEFNYRVRRLCGPLLLSPETYTNYFPPKNLPGIISQNFRNGFWNLRQHRLLSPVLGWRHYVPMLALVTLLGLLGLATLSSGAIFALLVLFGAYSALALWTSMSGKTDLDWFERPLVPPILAVTHASYGLGSVAGLIAFWVFEALGPLIGSSAVGENISPEVSAHCEDREDSVSSDFAVFREGRSLSRNR